MTQGNGAARFVPSESSHDGSEVQRALYQMPAGFQPIGEILPVGS